MTDESEIIKEMREEERLEELESKIQRAYEELKTPDEPIDDVPDKTVGFFENDTVFEAAEKSVQKSEEHCRILFDSISDGIYVLDEEWRYILVNKAAAQLVQMPKEKLLGNKITDIFPGFEKNDFFKKYQKVMKTKKSDVVTSEFSQPDGHKRWHEVKVYPTSRGILCITSDITKSKDMEEKLQESEQKFSGIVNSITDHMSMMDRDYNILWANGVAKRLFGEDVIGRKCYDVYHQRNAPCEPCIVSKTFQDDQVHEHETGVIGADGSRMTFWCKASVAGRDQDERPIRVIEVSRDMTECKKTEKELKRKIDELELFNEITVDRELKMIELKKEISELCEKYGEKPRYDAEEEVINEVK